MFLPNTIKYRFLYQKSLTNSKKGWYQTGIGVNFIFQQDVESCHTSKYTIQALKNLGISYIGPDR